MLEAKFRQIPLVTLALLNKKMGKVSFCYTLGLCFILVVGLVHVDISRFDRCFSYFTHIAGVISGWLWQQYDFGHIITRASKIKFVRKFKTDFTYDTLFTKSYFGMQKRHKITLLLSKKWLKHDKNIQKVWHQPNLHLSCLQKHDTPKLRLWIS